MNTAIFERRWSGDGRTSWSTLVQSMWLLAALLLLAPIAADASEPAGRVIFSAGTVTATDGEGFSRPLSRHDVVYPGETIDTGPRARAEIRMRDNALFSLDARSRFALERYGYDDDGGSAIMSFLRGTLRTITGALGKGENETYQMVTPVATIGVRGTQYALQWCDAACANPDRPAGLYGHVDEGAISVTNDGGSGIMSRDDYFHVADSDTAPRRLLQPPDGILGGESGGEGGSLEGAGDSLTSVDGGLLDGAGTLLTGDGGLLATGGSLLQTGGSLLTMGGNLLGTGSDLLGQGGGLLATGSGVLDAGSGLLDTGAGLLNTTGSGLGASAPLIEDLGSGGLLEPIGGLL